MTDLVADGESSNYLVLGKISADFSDGLLRLLVTSTISLDQSDKLELLSLLVLHASFAG